MTGHTLEQWEENWQTDMGAWFAGERAVYRGKDVFSQLYGVPWMTYYVFGITGKILNRNQSNLLESMWSLTSSYADPRLWNNRIASFATSARSTFALGVSASLAVSEATIFGLRPLFAICQMLFDARKKTQSGTTPKDFVSERLNQHLNGRPGSGKNRQLAKIPGFGRPLTPTDERNEPILKRAHELELDNGEFLALIYAIEHGLHELGYDWRMNSAALVCALVLDQDFTPRQAYQFFSHCFTAGFTACASDAENHPEGSFFPLRCERLNYTGPKPRTWQV